MGDGSWLSSGRRFGQPGLLPRLALVLYKHRPDHRAGGYEGFDRGPHPHGVQRGDNVTGNHVCGGVPSPRPIKKCRLLKTYSLKLLRSICAIPFNV